MDSLPVDMSNPAVQEYLSLVRLQVLTPLSLLINIATVLVCTVIVKPSIGGITDLYPTSISPNPALIAVYVLAIYVGQVGYCVLLVLARKPETKKAMVKAVGLSLVLANWFMALWAIAWVLQFFLVSTIFLGLILLLLIYSNIALLTYHPPSSDRPLDIALVHAPLRLFLILPLSLMFPYSLFITLGLSYAPDLPQDYTLHQWSGFGVSFGVNLLGLAVVITRRDIVWAVAATWICASIWSARPKPAPVIIVVILFTVLHPLGLLASMIYNRFYSKQHGRIALPSDENENTQHEHGGERRGPREVDVEALWG
ncbi:hypothetical protein SERLA73DRAFT_191309 [Serpula lacrymans var. lacrymans S7.3]|uniref:Uncharacterized protein n=2 Tax=Serpula lacrymans var. lacrymans TaxID=341189 RepID=F8QH99_SERL3|nr:uncharacterized protein SERLADRAFT_459933 [Serpula lacrymans var. lacrymans S7.9]EGN92348.1 hypothetical protein SERLA73DRAFT_191309 [Serpula lacrymans var. lacrymans S7.3]EGO27100.1 hypothetical protein SERLADRAFT_459933 [Serpula lacrymans var. lacrymans S7.9]